ncbi:hypothetical protein WJX84_001570 [Apatococcus fuscideae]|uniref:Uncharacterized protein n=1 Tax=Apatococcus fuscideae TaxID=2026836 RepID=A0AAW1TJE4_9CHLO
MRSFSVVLLLAGLLQVRSDVPLEWEVWSQGAQRHLLTEYAAHSPTPAPGGCPPSISQPFGSWLNGWQNAGRPEAAQANSDWTSVQARVGECQNIVSDYSTSVLVSLQTATQGLSYAVGQLTFQTASSQGAVTKAVSQAISSLQSCSAVAAVQGYSSAVAHYNQAAAEASNCLAASNSGHNDAGCASKIAGYSSTFS